MSRTVRTGGLCVGGFLGVGCLIWAMAVLPGAIEGSRAGGDLFAFLVVLLLLPALVVVVGLLVVIVTLFVYFDQHDTGRPIRALLRGGTVGRSRSRAPRRSDPPANAFWEPD